MLKVPKFDFDCYRFKAEVRFKTDINWLSFSLELWYINVNWLSYQLMYRGNCFEALVCLNFLPFLLLLAWCVHESNLVETTWTNRGRSNSCYPSVVFTLPPFCLSFNLWRYGYFCYYLLSYRIVFVFSFSGRFCLFFIVVIDCSRLFIAWLLSARLNFKFPRH